MKKIDIIAPIDNQEGTKMILRKWFVAVGDNITANQPIIELETDKVALEIAAPADGILSELIAETDAEVSPGDVLARMDVGAKTSPSNEDTQAADKNPQKTVQVASPEVKSATSAVETRLSPAVRRLVKDHGINTNQIQGTGKGRRITRMDVLAHLDGTTALSSTQVTNFTQGVESIPHDSMRRAIADHMVKSVTEAPHVTAFFELDFSSIIAHRNANKQAFAEKGVKLTFTAYFLMASAIAMKKVPLVNSRFRPDAVDIFEDVNIGVGTALDDKGLIVPVVHKVQNLSLFETAEKLQDITDRARKSLLKPSDMQGGTFTISNHGVSGSLLATPIIINQPQSAILGVGKLEKRVVVIDVDGQDGIAIKPMAYVSLTIDHRVLDGYQTNAWLSCFVETLEKWA